MGYEGWVGAEYHPRGRTENGLGGLSPIEFCHFPSSTGPFILTFED
jgi:hypothetical protein